MAYTKKTWVNVPDPSNPPSIPEGQDALARFDAENMNRIEEGVNAAKTHLENASLHNRATDGGGALGDNASTKGGAGAVGSGANAESGGAVGMGAKAISGGAIGYQAQTTSGGGAAGYMATTLSGGAIGSSAKSTNGGAVGNGARTSSGAAIGLGAQTVDESDAEIDAIQLGSGKNTTPKTLQAYSYKLMNADGTIPAERMPSKAPSGHGLGDVGEGTVTLTYKEFIQKGCGFYQVGNSDDSPHGTNEWTGLIQIARNKNKDTETGAQLAFYDFDKFEPKMWLRTLITGKSSDWVEMIHSGNYANFANAKIQTGTYKGTGTSGENNKNTLTFNFTPKIVIVTGKNNMNWSGTNTEPRQNAFFMYLWGHTALSGADVYTTHCNFSTNGNTLSWWYLDENSVYAKEQYNISGETYHWIAIG